MSDESEVIERPKLQFPVGEEPACDEGIAILQQLAEKHPAIFELASRNHFIDPSHPAVRLNPIWIAFAQHYSACEKCNEV